MPERFEEPVDETYALEREADAERWARKSPTPTLVWVTTEARAYSDADRVAAAEAELTRRGQRA